jgi:molecular chaperone DnaK (HSP70)
VGQSPYVTEPGRREDFCLFIDRSKPEKAPKPKNGSTQIDVSHLPESCNVCRPSKSNPTLHHQTQTMWKRSIFQEHTVRRWLPTNVGRSATTGYGCLNVNLRSFLIGRFRCQNEIRQNHNQNMRSNVSTYRYFTGCLNLPSNNDKRRRKIYVEQVLHPLYIQKHAQRRMYHVTKKQEIVPLIAVAAIVVVGLRYSYRAIQRMREEQEEYQYELQLYERQQMKQQPEDGTTSSTNSNASSSHSGSIITLAIDLGTVYAKLAAATYNPTSAVGVQVSREGDRSVFNGVLYSSTPDGNDNSRKAVKATGRAALERFYFPNTMDMPANHGGKDTVSIPFFELATHLVNRSPAPSQIISDVLKSRVSEVLDRIHSSSSISNALVRRVITVPCVFLVDEETVKVFSGAFDDCFVHSNGTDTTCVSLIPEPVATVWGAQFYNLLPASLPKDMAAMASYCVLDVGGYTTQVSIVQNDLVRHSSTIPWGGENIIERLVFVMKRQAAEPCNDSRSLALLQHHARQAVMELSTQSRVAVHVPYLYANPAQHHLDTSFARTVLNQAVEDHVRTLLQEELDWLPDGILSPHVPKPNDLTSLWTSILTQVLERSELLPTDVSAVLVVGGGSKTILIQRTVEEAWNRLTGGFHGRNALITNMDASLPSELAVVGAATLPPSFDYSWNRGLVRRR